jgi:metallophosphoesterase superfamily enzyme
METIFIGDIHGRSTWKSIIQKHSNIKRVIFMGDYFDNHLISTSKQIENFLDIVRLKENSKIEVIMLIGNHDHHYFPEVISNNITKYSSEASQSIIEALSSNRHHLQMAYQVENILCTHAGVGETFLKR